MIIVIVIIIIVVIRKVKKIAITVAMIIVVINKYSKDNDENSNHSKFTFLPQWRRGHEAVSYHALLAIGQYSIMQHSMVYCSL